MQTVNNRDWVLEPVEGKGGLAIANIRYFDGSNLQEDEVKAVVSVFGQKQLNLPTQIQHLRILIGDNPKQDISIFFNTSYTFINNNLQKTNVVVHCQAGVSRSVSIVMAYLMRKRRMEFQECLNFVKEKRPIAQPNKGFMKQLKAFGEEVKKMPEEEEKQGCILW